MAQNNDKRSPDDLLSDAMSLARQAYWGHIRSLAEDVIEHAREMETPCEDELDTYIHESIDGDAWVIYTAKAQMVLLVSDNDGAGVEQGLVDASCFKDGVPWEQLAFCAMREDLMEHLDALDFDPSDTDTWKPESEETE